MQGEKEIKWTHEWAHYDAAAIAVAAALAKSGDTDRIAVAKQAFAVADALAREAQYRPPVRVYASPMAWIRELHDAAEAMGQPLSNELSFLWRMAANGMPIAGTFWEMIETIRELPGAMVAELGNCHPDGVESMRLSVIRALEDQANRAILFQVVSDR
ncbi:MAG: hypothetical protein WC617_12185 [Rhodanobacter sp.]|jgi:hypothetical protein